MLTTALSTADVNALTAIALGKPVGRVATKTDALSRFARALEAKAGAQIAFEAIESILNAPGLEVAKGRVIAAIDAADAMKEAAEDDADLAALAALRLSPVDAEGADAPTEDDAETFAAAFAAAAPAVVAETEIVARVVDLPAPKAKAKRTVPTGAIGKLAGAHLYQITNDRREGTRAYLSAQIIVAEPGITFEAFVEKGGNVSDLRWDIKRGAASAEGGAA